MATHDIIGKSTPRYDAYPKADGSMPFGEDQIPEGALHCGCSSPRCLTAH